MSLGHERSLVCIVRQISSVYSALFSQTDEKTSQGQREAGRRLGERITDTTFWRNEVRNELEKLLTETSLLQDFSRALKKAIDDIEGPLHIAQECLYHREKRHGKFKLIFGIPFLKMNIFIVGSPKSSFFFPCRYAESSSNITI